MAKFNKVDARAILRSMLLEIYQDNPVATQFLASFFKLKTSRTKAISIEVQRMGEDVAVDQLRGTEGQRNSFDQFSAKSFIPPFFKEYFDATELDFYDVMFGQPNGEVDSGTIALWAEEISNRLRTLINKIKRRKELAASQVLHTGIVVLKNGDNIDFKRQPDSITDLGAGNYWDEANVDINTALISMMNFIRKEGKAQGGLYNIKCGALALTALLNNEKFQKRSDLKDIDLNRIHQPQRDSDGILHGEISVGNYKAMVWGYPEFYKEPVTGLIKPYIEDKKVIVTPQNPSFTMAHAAVPVTHGVGSTNQHIQFEEGEFVMRDYIDPKTDKHIFDVKSAFLPIPVGVDQIATALVVS